MREKLPWFLVSLLALGCGLSIVYNFHLRRELAHSYYECALSLEKADMTCREDFSTQYFERGHDIFACTESLCRANGWEPPLDWKDEQATLAEIEMEANHGRQN